MKHLHLTFVALSLIGFCLRGFWMLKHSDQLSKKWVRIAPHIIDTGLLASAIAMLVSYPLLPWQHPWLIAKIVALVLYIGLGTVAFKRHNSAAFIAAIATFIYIASVAVTKSPTLNLL
jgi:uncharacterized membrane protein SirB2